MFVRSLFLGALAALSAVAWPTRPPIPQGSLQQVNNSGIYNPTNVGFYVYVPKKLAPFPGVIAAIHYCTGSAEAYYYGSPYARLAEEYGFIVVYPSSPYSGTCWDVSSKSSLTHNGGGNSNSIANMVTWVIENYNADRSKVFVTGSSSGAMMTNVMAATYPELFQAATVYSGVPAGCFVSSTDQVDAWNSSCAEGLVDDSPHTWADVVFSEYPGYFGQRPRMQIYHGSIDAILLPPNYNETIKEWSGVFGYDWERPIFTQHNYPLYNYTRYTFGEHLQGNYALSVGHTVPINGTEDMKWFGFAR